MSEKGQGSGRIIELDGIRGIALALVLIWHYVPCVVEAAPGTALGRIMVAFGLTWAGVDVFFVLSGFLIGGILLDQHGSPRFFQAFYIRRLCRILPPYLFLLVACGLLWWCTRTTPDARYAWMFKESISCYSYPLFIQNFLMAEKGHFGPQPLGVTWSLAVEEQFYLLTPLLARRCRPRILMKWLILAVLLGILFRSYVYQSWPNGGHAAYVMLPCRADALCIGFLLAWAFRKPDLKAALCSPFGIKCLWGILLVSASVTALLGAWMQRIASPGMSYGGYTVIALCAAAFISLAQIIGEDSLLRRILRSKTLVWLGGISYTTYLVHEFVLGILHSVLLGQSPRIVDCGDVFVTIFSLIVTLAFATASYRWFEAPFIRYGHQFKY